MAVLAPTIGPVVGGWITDNWSWPWLFLINVIPGIIAASATPFLLPRQNTNLAELAKLDLHSLALMAIGACQPRDRLEAGAAAWLAVAVLRRLLLLRAAPQRCLFVRRTLRAAHPVVELSTLSGAPLRSAAP